MSVRYKHEAENHIHMKAGIQSSPDSIRKPQKKKRQETEK